MQRLLKLFLLLITVLYGNTAAFSTGPEGVYLNDPVPVASSVSHIALLLPLNSPAFGQAAEIVKQGFVTATMRGKALPLKIRIYATTDDPLDILLTYQQAVYAGAVMVVGPLTRDGVSALASSDFVTVPTLTLNLPATDHMLPPNLYLFGLQMEEEARQVAELAAREDRRHAIIIRSDSPLSIRLQSAFSDRWLQNGSWTTAEYIQFNDDPSALSALRGYTEGDDRFVFLALDAEKSRLIRAFLSPGAPVYATSQVFIDNEDTLFNHDLDKVKFVDMPWILQPDHPAVMAYQPLNTAMSMNMMRLYALGIDAFRLMAMMFQAQTPNEIAFDGVTGQIYFVPPNQFIRKSAVAVFDKGGVLLMDDATAHER
jgi:outer membrane PBP1 activator LpoA protein